MPSTDLVTLEAIRELLRARAARLVLDPTSIASPSPGVITARAVSGDLLRVEVSTYRAAELAR